MTHGMGDSWYRPEGQKGSAYLSVNNINKTLSGHYPDPPSGLGGREDAQIQGKNWILTTQAHKIQSGAKPSYLEFCGTECLLFCVSCGPLIKSGQPSGAKRPHHGGVEVLLHLHLCVFLPMSGTESQNSLSSLLNLPSTPLPRSEEGLLREEWDGGGCVVECA